MIAVLPTNPAGRLLAELCAHPDGATVEQLAASLLPAPRFPPPAWGQSPAQRAIEVSAWRAQVAGHRADAERRTSRLLGRLTERGLVSGRGAPRVASWAALAVADGRFRRRSDPWGALVEDYTGTEAPSVARLLVRVVESSPGSRSALGLTTQGERAYDRAVAAGLLLPPTLRLATEAGRALAASWSAP